MPRVSIVIVNWKTPGLLARCLDSLKQDPGFDDFETWVVDNNSEDESLEMLARRYPEVKVIANKANLGFSKACNQVIPIASHPYILLLNPDAVITGQAITKMANFLEQHPECGAVGPKVLNPDGTLQLACRRSFPSPKAAFFRLTYLSKLFPKSRLVSQYNLTFENPDQVHEVDALSGSCMMVCRQAVDRVGLLDEDIFMFGEDIDWCWRIKQAGYRVYYLPDAVVYHIHGASSRLRPVGATINLHKGMEVFYRKHLAPKHHPLFNCLVYLAIWMRAMLFILINLARGLLTRKHQIEIPEPVTPQPLTGNFSSRSGN
ncbi:MAG TPA: glycosyltransferase family 2 protein [Candidatus Obscuribacterales bacterium]